MSIPATERRGERRAAAEPQPNRTANGVRASNGRPPQREGRKHQGRTQEARSQQGRPQHQQPQQKQPQQGRHRDAPRNGNPRHEQNRTDDVNGWMPVRFGQAAPAGRAADANDISAVAFMKQPKRGGHRRGAPAHHRAPR
jgi:hypothetical protein